MTGAELGVRYVTIMPKIGTGFAGSIKTEVGKGVNQGATAFGQLDRKAEVAGAASGQKFGSRFGSAAGPLIAGVGVTAIAGLVKSSVDAYAEMQDASSAAAVVFGKDMDKIEAQAKTAATTMGMSKKEVIDAAMTFGTYGKSANLAGDDLATFSTRMVALAGDMASFRGTSTEQAVEAIGAAMRGEMEPIRAYSVQLDDATLRQQALKMGLISTVKEALNPQQKVLATQAAILAKTTYMVGDYARTSDSAANVQKTMQKSASNLSVELGEKLEPALTAARKSGIDFLTWVYDNQTALMPLVGTIGTLTLAVGGFVAAAKGIEALKSAKATVDGLKVSFDAMSTSAKIATVSAGAIGLAVTAVSIGYGIWANASQQAQQRVEDLTQAIKADSGALGENSRAYAFNALKKSGALDAAQKLGVANDVAVSAALGEKDALDQINAAYAARTKAVEDAAAAQGADRNAYLDSKAALTELGSAYNLLGGNITGLQGDTQKALANEKQFNEAVNGTTTSASKASSATSDLGDSINGTKVSAYTGKITFENYTKAIEGNYNATIKLRGDQRSLEAAIDDVTESVKKNGKTLDIHTEKGRANQQALDGVASAGLDLVEGLKAVNAPTEKIAAQMDKSRASFIKAAESMGMSSKEAEKLANKLGLIKGKNIEVTASVSLNRSADEIVYKVGKSGTMKFTAKAAGGRIIGPGTGTSDDILMAASDGEWVIKEKSASYYGPIVMDAINQQKIPRGVFAGAFAGGGPVMPSYNGHSLDWWKDYLLSDVEFTRLQIQIRDLKSSLSETEIYNPPGRRKRASRQKLRGLDRTAAQQELKEATDKLALARQAAQANSSVAGSIADQISQYEESKKSYEDAMAIWQNAADSLSRSAGIGSLDPTSVKRTNAAGDVWYEKKALTAADLAGRVNKNAAQVKEFIGLLGDLRKAGASDALIADIEALGPADGSIAAKLYLADLSSLASANAAYASIADSRSTLTAIGNQAAKIDITINEAATPQATSQAVTNKILAGRT